MEKKKRPQPSRGHTSLGQMLAWVWEDNDVLRTDINVSGNSLKGGAQFDFHLGKKSIVWKFYYFRQTGHNTRP